MKTVIFALLFAIVTKVSYAATQESQPTAIKILLHENVKNVLIEAKGRFDLYNPATGEIITSSPISKREFLHQTEDGLIWGNFFPTVFQLRFVPGDSQAALLVNGIQYKGTVEVYDIDGSLSVVNEVDVENYLRSILTTKFPQPLPREVLESLAIIARTDAYFLIGKNIQAFWNLNAKEIDYQGCALARQHYWIDSAIDKTRGSTMTYEGLPFAATWTKNSAGKTANYSAIFRKSVKTPPGVNSQTAANEREQHQWSYTISSDDLAKAIGVKSVDNIDLYLDKNSSKVYALKIKDGAQSSNFDFFQFQRVLSSERIKSNDFSVSVKNGQVIFNGFGEGHGVGLCLYSALKMAEKGDSAQAILSAFFPQTEIKKIQP